MRDVVITTYFAKGLPTAPRTTIRANCNSAVSTLGYSPIATRRTDVAVASYMLDLAVPVHAAFWPTVPEREHAIVSIALLP